MNWLGRIWSKIWVEQRRDILKSEADSVSLTKETETPSIPSEELNPYFVEGENFQLLLSFEWRPMPAKDEGQKAFHHERLDIELVSSSLAVQIPNFKLEKTAQGWAEIKTTAVDGFKRELGVYPVGVQDDILEQSWGYQVSIIRTYVDSEFYRCFGFVSAELILNLTFEGRMTEDRQFDEEIEKVIASVRFSDSVWGDRDFPEGSQLQ